MVYQVKVLSAKTDNMNSTYRTYMGEEENLLASSPMFPACMCTCNTETHAT